MFESASLGINHYWAKLAVEELLRLGVTDFCISPGSRSSALTLALAQDKRCRNTVHYDERGAAFFALGMARSERKPVCLVCTSGSALANYFPAVIEARQAQIPLLLLSADRPVELRESGANQTINQLDFFGKNVQWSFSLPAPQDGLEAGFLLSVIDQAVYRSTLQPAGPVHINFEFREPLLSEKPQTFELTENLRTWADGAEPYTVYSANRTCVERSGIDLLVKKIKAAQSGLIVAAQISDSADRQALLALSQKIQWPILADITSGLRQEPGHDATLLCSHYGFYLGDAGAAEYFGADLVLHFGSAPLSKTLQNFLNMQNAGHVLINNGPFRQEFGARIEQRLQGEISDIISELLLQNLGQASSRLAKFKKAEEACLAVLEEQGSINSSLSELFCMQALLRMLPKESALYLGNSLPIRHADLVCAAENKNFILGFQRGVSGIDGNIASACGFACGASRKTSAVIGDLTCLHDLNSLALTKQVKNGLVLIVFNNNGGGIFNYLPVLPVLSQFEGFFTTPHGLGFKAAAEMFGLQHFMPNSMAEFRENYTAALNAKHSCLIELKTNKEQNTRLQQDLIKQVCLKIWE